MRFCPKNFNGLIKISVNTLNSSYRSCSFRKKRVIFLLSHYLPGMISKHFPCMIYSFSVFRMKKYILNAKLRII